MKNDKIQNKDILENFNDGKAYEVFVQKMQQELSQLNLKIFCAMR